MILQRNWHNCATNVPLKSFSWFESLAQIAERQHDNNKSLLPLFEKENEA